MSIQIPVLDGGPKGGNEDDHYMKALKKAYLPADPLVGSYYVLPLLYGEAKILEGLAILDRALTKVEPDSEYAQRIEMIMESYDCFRIQRTLMDKVSTYCFNNNLTGIGSKKR